MDKYYDFVSLKNWDKIHILHHTDKNKLLCGNSDFKPSLITDKKRIDFSPNKVSNILRLIADKIENGEPNICDICIGAVNSDENKRVVNYNPNPAIKRLDDVR